MSATSERATQRGDAVGAILLALSAFQFGLVVIFGKVELRTGIPVVSMLGIRFGLAALLLVPVLAAVRLPLAPVPGERLGIVVIGMAGYAVEASLFFAAVPHGTAGAVTLLFFTYPVFVTLASWTLGKGRPGWLTVAALACAVTGAALIIGTSGGIAIETIGVVFALGAALMFTAYLIGADHVIRRTNALTGSMWQAAAASFGLLVSALVTGNFDVPTGWHGWWPVFGMSACTAGAFVCLLEGLKRLGSVRTAIISSSEPLTTAVLGFALLGEKVGVGLALGGVLIVVGSMMAATGRKTVTPGDIP